MNVISSHHPLFVPLMLSVSMFAGIIAPSSPGIAQVAPAPDSFPQSDCGRYRYAAMSTQRQGKHILTLGTSRWIVFDLDTRSAIASGPVDRPSSLAFEYGWSMDAAGGIAVVASLPGTMYTGLLLLDVPKGRLIADLGLDYYVSAGVAPDGGYAWRQSLEGIVTWSPTGKILSRWSGAEELSRHLFAAPGGELRSLSHSDNRKGPLRYEILDVAAGSTRIVTPPEGVVTGTAMGWFADGSHFMSRRADRVQFFRPDHVLVQEVALPTNAYPDGFGQYYYDRRGDQLAIFRVGGPTNADGSPIPVLSVPHIVSGFLAHSHGSLALQVRDRDTFFQLIDLRGKTLTATTIQLPSIPTAYTFSSDDAGDWSIVAGGEIFASVPGARDKFVKLGCRAP